MNIQTRAGINVLLPEGDLTIFEAAEFRENLIALHQQEDPIELDLTDVERMDSSGVQLIIAGVKSSRMTIAGLTESMRDKFKKIGCEQFVKTVEAST